MGLGYGRDKLVGHVGNEYDSDTEQDDEGRCQHKLKGRGQAEQFGTALLLFNEHVVVKGKLLKAAFLV